MFLMNESEFTENFGYFKAFKRAGTRKNNTRCAGMGVIKRAILVIMMETQSFKRYNS